MRALLRRAPRLVALSIGLAILAAVELSLRALGVGDFRDRPDPFAGFSNLTPTFVPRRTPGGVEILDAGGPGHPTRRFLARKPANGFRVFAFGGSSVAGTPYGYDHAFPELLRQRLSEAFPERTIEVVNCALPGLASRRLRYLAEEAATYEPDLFVVYTGHNEMLEQRVYAHLVQYPQVLFDLSQRLRRLHLYVLLEDAVRAVRGFTPPEIEEGEIYVRGFGARMNDDAWKDAARDPVQQRFYALRAFTENVERIVHAGQQAGADVLLMTQSKNYADWPVTETERSADLAPEDQAALAAHLEAADRARDARDAEGEIAALRRALEVDPDAALLHQRLADRLRAAGRGAEAREAYARAHDRAHDAFGTTPERNRAIRQIARRRGTLLVDVEQIFQRESPDGLVGYNLFVDFLHPSLVGQQRLELAVEEALLQAGIPEPAPAWRARRPFPEPAAILAADPSLRPRELHLRILAEIVSGREGEARTHLAELRRIAPDDEKTRRIERWMREGVPLAPEP